MCSSDLKITEQGLTLVPIELYENKGLVKLALGIAKGKKLYDKREVAAKKEAQRKIEQTKKYY